MTEPTHGDRAGTITAYTYFRCRCPECREAWRDWMREHRANPSVDLVDAARTREYVHCLTSLGVSLSAIARATGVESVRYIDAREQRRVRAGTAYAVEMVHWHAFLREGRMRRECRCSPAPQWVMERLREVA